jgi:hypothetical protein
MIWCCVEARGHFMARFIGGRERDQVTLFPEQLDEAIDGSKFKAVNNREKNFTHDRLAKRMQSIEEGAPAIWPISIVLIAKWR